MELTMENVVNKVNAEFNKYLPEEGFLSSREINEIFFKNFQRTEETFDEDFDEFYNLLDNSKMFNYVLLRNGDGYYFRKNLKAVKKFINDVEISNSDNDVWNTYVEINGKNMKLYEVLEND